MSVKSKRKDLASKTNSIHEVRRAVGKSGKILTVDYLGRPSHGKIVKLVGFHPETPVIEKIVPVYQECSECNLFLGHLEEVNADELDNMCIDCFKIEIGEKDHFSPLGESNVPCISCGLYMEKGDDLFSTINDVCNHCYLRKMNLDKTHSCIHCNPTFKVTSKRKLSIEEYIVTPQIFSRKHLRQVKSGDVKK
ncbi:MAG: hypothetical protein CXT78_02900 [Thaumarchaeota archaeon]|jgi:hypothetical protein|nr:MAG: hypothetical protein CXT78_02900 [Nitrososphaerota archaeon]